MAAEFKLPETKPPFLSPLFLLMSLMNFLQFSSLYLTLPVVPLFVRDLGASEFEVGLTGTAFFTATLLSRTVAGRLIIRYGYRTPLLIGAGAALASAALYPMAVAGWMVGALRALQGAGFGLFTTAATTAVANAVPDRRRAEALGVFGISVNTAAAASPAVGLFLLGTAGYEATFGVGAALSMVCLAIAWPAVRGTGAPGAGAPVPGGTAYPLGRRLLIPGLVLMLYGFSYATHVNFIPLLAEQRGISGAGLYFTAYALSIITARSFSGRIGDRFGRSFMIIPGALVCAGGTALLAGAASLPGLLLAAMVYGLGSGSLHPGVLAHMVDLVPAERRAAATATFYASFEMGIGLGGPAIGLMARGLGLQGAVLVTAILCASGAALHLLGGRRHQTA